MDEEKKFSLERLAEVNRDREELIAAFERFSHKYGEDIVGFIIERGKNTCWKLRGIVMDGDAMLE